MQEAPPLFYECHRASVTHVGLVSVAPCSLAMFERGIIFLVIRVLGVHMSSFGPCLEPQSNVVPDFDSGIY